MTTQAQTPDYHPDGQFLWTRTVPKLLNYLVLVLSLGLIAFISWDTYRGVNYLESPIYMKYQFAVCLVFLAEYIYRFIISKHKIRFLFLAFPFLVISIPYTNIISYYNINVSAEVLHYICSVPIFRGLVALIMVVNYVAKKASTTVFFSYVLVLVPSVYMGGLFFYVAEKAINPGIKNFWYAMWWAGMTVTTIGCDINPMTATGMVLGFIISLLGIIMLPLFTVYFGQAIQTYDKYTKEHH
ncbi:MAG: two pore domain potassium channel family protein [Desulfovibrio sp.]|nr:two pore domain potassium channel family protein [Desulfovibrio sp.]